ncbi:MAG: hypothetical protein H6934_04455 [Burkholderiaceae bacterium]|nr:hypothetical protein [Burkholderiaceae bacterium]
MIYSIEFFDLQLRFAAKVAELVGVPLAQAIGSHTNIFVRLGFGTRLDHSDSDWSMFASSLSSARDPLTRTYEVYRQRAHISQGPKMEASVGCFSIAPFGPDAVRIHFKTGAESPHSPLSLSNMRARRTELAEVVSRAAARGRNVQVVGASWLYSLPCYRRLFPESYLAGLTPMAHPYDRMPLWGQFLRRDGSVRTGPVDHFNAHLASAKTAADLSACFPLQVLRTSGRADAFLVGLGADRGRIATPLQSHTQGTK